MHSSTFGKGWVGMSACPLVVLACKSLHVCTVCIWRCEHARFCVEVFYALYINFHSFIHSNKQKQPPGESKYQTTKRFITKLSNVLKEHEFELLIVSVLLQPLHWRKKQPPISLEKT